MNEAKVVGVAFHSLVLGTQLKLFSLIGVCHVWCLYADGGTARR